MQTYSYSDPLGGPKRQGERAASHGVCAMHQRWWRQCPAPGVRVCLNCVACSGERRANAHRPRAHQTHGGRRAARLSRSQRRVPWWPDSLSATRAWMSCCTVSGSAHFRRGQAFAARTHSCLECYAQSTLLTYSSSEKCRSCVFSRPTLRHAFFNIRHFCLRFREQFLPYLNLRARLLKSILDAFVWQ